MSDSSFGALGVPEDLAACLARAEITSPSPIQRAVIPDALAGRDVIGRAPTGSGKTFAFGLPLITVLPEAKRRRPTALVLAPTRELAQQIADELRPLASVRGRKVAAVYGGIGYGAQRKALDAGVDAIVACPGRLEDLITMGAVSLDAVRHVVVDEADRMADMGFLPAVRRLIGQTAERRQVLMFSATVDGAVGKLSSAVQHRPVRHEIESPAADVSTAHHVFWRVEATDRVTWTAEVVRRLGSTMVFCRTRHGADRIAKQLNRSGLAAAAIHGGRSQPQRDRALRAFADGTIAALVATDVAARGVHVDDVAAVVHFDPPGDVATYVHRSGRTARAGASGVVVSLLDGDAERDARSFQEHVGARGRCTPPSLDQLTRPPVVVIDAPAAVEAVATGRETGTVAFFHERRGFGFISREGAADVYLHRNNLNERVTGGQRVEYSVGRGRKGLEALNVVAV